MFKLVIETTTDAFTPDPAPEPARLLRRVTDDVEAGRDEGVAVDRDGNRCGEWSLTTDI